MATWKEFTSMTPELAAWGEKRFKRSRMAFLATVSADGTPHIYPVQPLFCQGHLLIFADASSPKAANLKRSGTYTLHSFIDNLSGMGGEFSISGSARLIEDRDVRHKAIEATCYTPKGDVLMFELNVESALARDYDDGKINEMRWEPAYS